MDEQQALLEREEFLRVWRRVSPESFQQAAPTVEQGILPAPSHQPEGQFLRERIEEELKNSRSCLLLFNQYGMGQEMLELSRRCEHRAKRLAAVLMLSAGVWYLPKGQVQGRRWKDHRSGLCGLFHIFRQESRLYAAGAERFQDEMLRELCGELSGDSAQMSARVRRLLEQ